MSQELEARRLVAIKGLEQALANSKTWQKALDKAKLQHNTPRLDIVALGLTRSIMDRDTVQLLWALKNDESLRANEARLAQFLERAEEITTLQLSPQGNNTK